MGQEFFINSEELEGKIRDLLPSQGGAGAGFDLSASTQIIPIVDLTETASGSSLREDLQKAMHHSTTFTTVSNTTTTILNNPGFYQVIGNLSGNQGANAMEATLDINNGSSDTTIYKVRLNGTALAQFDHVSVVPVHLIIYLQAGFTFKATTSQPSAYWYLNCQQIASNNGSLINPTGFSAS